MKANIAGSIAALKPLQALGEVLDADETPDPADVAQLAGRPELRHALFRLLSVYEKTGLMPVEACTPEAQAEAALAETLIRKTGTEGGAPDLRFAQWVHAMVDGNAMRFGVLEFSDPLTHDQQNMAVVLSTGEEVGPYASAFPVLACGAGGDADVFVTEHLERMRAEGSLERFEIVDGT